MTNFTIGIDISKDSLDAHRWPDGATGRFPNTPAGHKTLIRWIGTHASRIVFEPTGPYHRALEQRLSEADQPLVRSILVRRAALPRQLAGWPRPTASMRLCWRVWGLSLIYRLAKPEMTSSTI